MTETEIADLRAQLQEAQRDAARFRALLEEYRTYADRAMQPWDFVERVYAAVGWPRYDDEDGGHHTTESRQG